MHMDAFISVISEHLAAVGYSIELHRALLQAQAYLGSSDNPGDAALKNSESATQPKRQRQGAQKPQAKDGRRTNESATQSKRSGQDCNEQAWNAWSWSDQDWNEWYGRDGSASSGSS